MNQPLLTAHAEGRPAPVLTDSVALQLRRCTHQAHARINQHPMLSGLTKPAYPLARYKVLLAAYFDVYAGIERGIDSFLADAGLAFDYERRRKLPWLDADLAHFGIDPASIQWHPCRPAAIAPPASVGELIGMLYVIEGATLGGQLISRHLGDTLGLTAGTGARFFSGYGDALETQRRWREFGVFADSILLQPQQRSLACDGAVCVFDSIEKVLNDCHARFVLSSHAPECS
jgi:heme oxygenase